MGTLAVLCIILAVVGVVVILIVLLLPENKEDRVVVPALFFGTLTLMFVAGGYLFGSAHYQNHFHSLYEEYQTAQANVGVMEQKADILGEDLEVLLNTYIGHERSLIDVVEERNIEELRLLFERPPQLQASSNVQQVTKEFITLVEDIVQAKLVVNAVARAYNTSQRVIPVSWFAPDDLPSSLALLSPAEKE